MPLDFCDGLCYHVLYKDHLFMESEDLMRKQIKSALSRISAGVIGVLMLTAGTVANAPAASAGEYARVSVHDPSIVKLEDGSYYIIGSHLGAGRSDDLMNWTDTANSSAGTKNTTYFSDIYTDLAEPCKWSNTSTGYDLSGNLWAPDIVWNPEMNKYCMYLSVNGENWHSSIVLCTADNIDGPYTYVDTIVYSGFETNPINEANSYKNTDVEKVLGSDPDLGRYLNSEGRWNAEYGTNAIDPGVFYDEAGKLWMVYGSWFGGIYMLELDEKTGLRDYSVTYPTVKDQSDAYMGTKVAGGYWASGEGAYIEYMTPPGGGQGYYYMFLSYGYFHPNGGYNMRVFRSTSPTGPYYDQNGNPAVFTKGTDNIGGNVGMRLMSNYQWSCNENSFKAQGHNSVLMDDDGKLYVIYHTKFGGLGLFHQVRVHQLIMNEDGWITAAPYEYSGESLSESGHTMEALVGDYEFLVHDLDQGYKVEWSESDTEDCVGISRPVDITLNSDGTFTGDVSGTWTVEKDSHYMSITYNGVTYKGAFIVQADESSAMVKKMTFTATGSNMTVWGSKKTEYTLSDDMVDRTGNSLLAYNPSGEDNSNSDVYLGDTDLLSGVSYSITNRFNGLSLDVPDGKAEEGVNLQQWTLTGGSHQEWRITATSGGYCKITSMTDENYCIAVAGNTADDGLDIQIQKYTGADSQQWKIVENRGSYGIVSKSSGDKSGIDVYGWSTENGGAIKQWNYWGGDCQLWNIEPVYPKVNTGRYSVKNVNSRLWLGTDDTNGALQTDVFTSWNITEENGSYIFTNDDGMALTVKDGSSADGADIYLSEYTGDSAQRFTLYPNEDGSYAILTEVSGELSGFDVFGISLDAGAKICQWNYWGGSGQKFIIEPAAVPEIVEPETPGDLNYDQQINIFDLMLAKGMLRTFESGDCTGKAQDWNGDGEFTIADVVGLQKYLINAD